MKVPGISDAPPPSRLLGILPNHEASLPARTNRKKEFYFDYKYIFTLRHARDTGSEGRKVKVRCPSWRSLRYPNTYENCLGFIENKHGTLER